MAVAELAAGDWEQAPRFRKVSAGVFNAVVGALWRTKVAGLEHVPRVGPVILAGNHVHAIDGLLIAAALAGRRYVRGVAKQELFRVPVVGWWLHHNGYVPLDRSGDVSAMRWGLQLLESGGCMGIFPEGTRSRTGRPGRPKAGVSFLAGRTGAPVVPVHVINTDRLARLPRLELRFGAALRFGGDPADRKACLEFAQQVMDRVFAL